MIPIVETTSSIHACAGGWSRMLAAFLHMLLLGPQGLATAGVTCVINGLPLTIYAKVGNILADYDGVRIGWDWRGANCIRPCLRCANLFKKNTDLARRIPNCVEMTCTSKAMLMERSQQQFEDDVDLVTEAGASFAMGRTAQQDFNNICMVTGQNFNPIGMVADKTLRLHFSSLNVLNQDWVHGILSDGILAAEIANLIDADANLTRADCEAFLKSDLQFPQSVVKGKYLWRIFDQYRNHDDKIEKIRADASELLGLYALMRHLVEKRFLDRPDDLAVQRASFDRCCKIVDLILDMKNGLVDPRSESACQELQDSIFTHLALTQAAYGQEHIKPKHHLNTHLPEQFLESGVFT